MVTVKRSLSATPTPPPSPSPTTPKKKVKTTKTTKTTKTATPKSSPGSYSGGSSSGGGGKKTGSWTGEEIKRLYRIMCPKRVGVNWAEVAKELGGRDMKSCQNKWARVQGKLEKAIEELGD